jgi:hypothetical protein
MSTLHLAPDRTDGLVGHLVARLAMRTGDDHRLGTKMERNPNPATVKFPQTGLRLSVAETWLPKC